MTTPVCDFASGRLVVGWMLKYEVMAKEIEATQERNYSISEYLQDPSLINLTALIPEKYSSDHRPLTDYEIIRTEPIFDCADRHAWYYLTIKVHPDSESCFDLIEKITRVTTASSIEIPRDIAKRLGACRDDMRFISAANIE